MMGFHELDSPLGEMELPKLEPLDSHSLHQVENSLNLQRQGSLDNFLRDINESSEFFMSDPSFRLDLDGMLENKGVSSAGSIGTPVLLDPKKKKSKKHVKLPPPVDKPASGRRMTRRQSSTIRFNSIVQKLHESNSQDWNKQNCHYCGRCRPLSERYTCKNQYCSLQGQRVKYMCKLCYGHQSKYFADRGLDVKQILGDVEDPSWWMLFAK